MLSTITISGRTKLLAFLLLISFAIAITLLGRFVLNSQPVTPNGSSPSFANFAGCYGINLNNVLIPEMVEIPAGHFLMGSEADKGSANEHPQHKVSVDKFLISRFEITNAQYSAFCQLTGRAMPDDPRWQGNYIKDYPNHPIVNITWQDAMDYCKWLSELTGQQVRLPTEAEWEYAAQDSTAGTTLEKTQYKQLPTTAAGLHTPSKFGLYDMLGNVWEWCLDWYDVQYYVTSPTQNPTGPEQGQFRVLRGGSWADRVDNCRITGRRHSAPDGDGPTVGFRIVAIPH
ncbi:MAG: formylglycine-generating enzyme family protein [Acidobacteriota bacterium]